MNYLRNKSNSSVVNEPVFRSLINASFPEQLTEESVELVGYNLLLEGERPTNNSVYKEVVRAGEEEIDGKWYTKYVLQEKDKDLVDNSVGAVVRKSRDERLAATDWTQLKDTQLSESKEAEWSTYRQALRDLPTASGFPHTMTWPTKPF